MSGVLDDRALAVVDPFGEIVVVFRRRERIVFADDGERRYRDLVEPPADVEDVTGAEVALRDGTTALAHAGAREFDVLRRCVVKQPIRFVKQ